ncbi:MAG: cyclase family protein [Nocardiopsaceae bacterium]|nr:cyclase family protein [Nocardiopsaceae bacterium]
MNSSAHETKRGHDPKADASEQWWPSPFGEDDEHGMLNHITDAKRREALALVGEGRLYDLGHVLDEHSPVFPGRYFRQTLVTTAHQINADPGEPPPSGLGDNKVNWVTVVVAGTMQEGTHIDGLNHLQIGDRGYNGWKVAALAGPAGTKRLGAETIPQIVTRGWLVDVAAGRGVEQLKSGDVITTEDVHRALDGREPGAGDALLFHTGWGSLWADPDSYLAGEPGPGLDLGRWIAERGIAITGCDTWSYGPVPAEDKTRPFEVPQTLNVRHGVFVVENLDTSELAAQGVKEFAFILTHPKLRGAAGAWTSPIAMV